MSRWRPKLLESLDGYTRRDFLADLVAGVTVGLVALPLAMAFGIASGVTPQAGIYTAIVAYNMGEWREIGSIMRLELADKAVWVITFALTVLADLTVAVEVGMALAALLYIHRVTETTSVAAVTDEYIEDGRPHVLQDKQVPAYVTTLRIHGPFLFGMTDKLIDATADLSKFGPFVVLRLRNMTAIDATGLHALEQLSDRLKRSGRTLLLCGARHQPAQLLEQAEFVEHVGKDNILPHVEAALRRARQIHSQFAGLGEHVAQDLLRSSL